MSQLITLEDNGGGAAGMIVIVVLVGIGVYFVPSIVAAVRKVPNVGSVAVVNTLLGWTLVGWAVAMAMAMRSRPQAQQVVVNVPGYQPPMPGYQPPVPGYQPPVPGHQPQAPGHQPSMPGDDRGQYRMDEPRSR